MAGSLALRDCANPDHIDTVAVRCPVGVTADPAAWARHVFSIAAMPRWVAALMGLRQAAVRLIGLPPSGTDVFDVREVDGREALVAAHEAHLDFWAAVGVDPEEGWLWLTTAVRLRNWRGRLYWSVVRWFHPVVVTAMLRRAAARPPVSPPGGTPRP